LAAQLATLVSFNGPNGEYPGGLTADANRDLFGTTDGGGANGYGTVFEIANSGAVAAPVYASAPTTLVSFNNSDGAGPVAGLIADANGDLFGMTVDGGANGYGTVFEIKNTGTVAAPVYASAPTTLVSFNNSDGANPIAGLTADANGDLFGTTEYGGPAAAWQSEMGYGTVFEIQNTGTVAAPVYANTPAVLASFNGSNGAYSHAGLTADANGDLFGTTQSGGANNDGTVFEIKNTGTVAAPIYASAPTTLVNFYGFNGQTPLAGLIADANSDLFGTTESGTGGSGYGTVFEIKNTGTIAAPVYASAPTTLANFNGYNGADPRAGLTADANGDLLGVTMAGGANNYGTVFELQNTGTVAAPVYASAPTTLVSFNNSDGAGPVAGLIADANGDLLGTASGGGANGYGTVFEISGVGLSAPTIAGTVGGQMTTMEAPVAPFAGVTVGDRNAGATDTLTITLGGADGTLADGMGFNSLTSVGAGVYRLSGAFSAITRELNALSFKPKAGAPNTSSTTRFTLSDQSSAGGAPVVDSTTSVIDSDPAVAPTIAGTVSGQTTTSEASVKPFVHVTVGDRNGSATDTLTITLGGMGGTLSGTGLSGGAGGIYTLTGTATAISSELDALVFTPKAGAPNRSTTTTFTMSDQSSAHATPAVDSTTSVIDSDPAVTPTIAGAVSGQTTTSEAVVKPFAHATIGDANAGATDTLTISIGGAGGTLSGMGLNGGVGGVYSLSGTAAAISSELEALLFTPLAGAPSTSSTTTFTLGDQSSASSTPVVDSTTSVIDSDPAVAPRTPTLENFSVVDTTTNTSFQTNGTPYYGPVAGLQWEDIDVTTDNLNVTSNVPNVFIHTGSGEDAIDVSNANGNNVLDGSTGSNFLVGGSGDDTFFVDDRGPSADIWSTVANFHAGDAATIFGITQQGFDTSWVDGQGATGYTGLTLHVTSSGHPTASLTLAGFSTADLSNGRISTTWGTEADGTPYLYVHANS
jgi:uncharacterized repeat protein (TIGR03803 family)